MKKRFLILGAGAIGSYLGGSLALHGHDVLFLEREKDIPTLQTQGVLMEIGGEKYTATSPEFTSSLDLALSRNCDLVILAVKTYHLDAILPDLLRVRDDLPPLLSLQNGVESDQKLVENLGLNLVIPGTITSAVDCPSKGNIIVSKLRGMGISGSHPITKDLVQIFREAGIDCSYYTEPANMKWSKLVTNLLGNASSAILNLPPSEIYSDSALYRIELEQIREALLLMRVQGINAVNLPGVPVKILAIIIRFLPSWLSQPLLARMIGAGRGQKMPSFHKDLYSGKGKSEVNQLNGAVVRAGKRYHIPTPVNSFLTDTLMSLINGDISLETYSKRPEKLLLQLEAFKSDLI